MSTVTVVVLVPIGVFLVIVPVAVAPVPCVTAPAPWTSPCTVTLFRRSTAPTLHTVPTLDPTSIKVWPLPALLTTPKVLAACPEIVVLEPRLNAPPPCADTATPPATRPLPRTIVTVAISRLQRRSMLLVCPPTVKYGRCSAP